MSNHNSVAASQFSKQCPTFRHNSVKCVIGICGRYENAYKKTKKQASYSMHISNWLMKKKKKLDHEIECFMKYLYRSVWSEPD